MLSKDLYKILEVDRNSDKSTIKKSFYNISKKYHPDLNKDSNLDIFNSIIQAYEVLSDVEKKSDYDSKSIYGNSYDERLELLDFEFSNTSKSWNEDKLNDFRKNEVLNIIIHVDEEFDGYIEYERWIICKDCNGTGKDIKSKIEIKDKDGKILKVFESDGGCDYCEGTGKNYLGQSCSFCFGQGKTGSKNCEICKGNKRILGKQKVNGIIFNPGSNDHKIDFMGNFSKDIPGKVGHLWLVKKSKI